ncbi:hypothetical protein [Candidatus Clostridium radicumherbarum]|uniref:Uncharacterized protein n=1 Tax=Candidatus Clostridium radicumherbarum TaxID=3381662 RepID=A0ABW8TRA0_9CLOT
MINLREIRISLLYFFYFVLMISVLLFVRKHHLLTGSIRNIGIGVIILVIIVTFILFAIIPCIAVSIYHLVKAVRYNKVYYKEKHYADWRYSKDEWTSFINNNYRINNRIEIKSFKKAAVYFSIVVFIAYFLYFLTNIKDRKNMPAYILIAVASFLICFIPVMIKNKISMNDHLLFTNRSVILMQGTIIVNGEIFNLDVPLKKEMMKKQIRNGNLEIEYAVPARYSDKYSNRRYLNVKDVKKLIIPIPSDKHEEAVKYINVPLPITVDYRK